MNLEFSLHDTLYDFQPLSYLSKMPIPYLWTSRSEDLIFK